MCRTLLVEESTSGDNDAIVGDECHISAQSERGPRGTKTVTDDKDDLNNLILLCRNHHKLVDDQPNDYPVALLQRLKREHEAWVEHALELSPAPSVTEDQMIGSIDDRLSRLEFLQEWSFPLRYIALLLDLRSPINATELGHFRALITFVRSGAGEFDTLCLATRDAYPVLHEREASRTLIGVRQLAWLPSADTQLLNLQLCHGQTETAQIVAEVPLRQAPAFTTLPEIEESVASVYLSEPLWRNTAGIGLVVNDYVLSSFPASQLAVLQGAPTDPWPDVLSDEEEGVPWLSIMPRGPDYDRYEAEGDRPDFFPSQLYRPWIPDLSTVTPQRIRRGGPAA